MPPPNFVSDLLPRLWARGEAPAFLGRDGTVCCRDLAIRVEGLAERLRELEGFPREGIGRIGVFCRGGVDHAVAMLAIMQAGACAVPVAEELSCAERVELARITALDAVICGPGEVWSDEGGATGGAVEKFRCLPLAPGEPAFPREAWEAVAPAFVRFSSGTTGRSKGVVLSHGTLRRRIESAAGRLGIGGGDRVLWTLPMAHHFVVSILLYLHEGAAVVLPEGPLAADFLDAAERHEATVFYGTPFQAALLAADRRGGAWPSLRLAISTAASLRPETSRQFSARFGRPIFQALGLIEAGLPLLNRNVDEPLAVGCPNGDFEVRLDGESEGELCLRGPGMFDAYLSPWQTRDEVLDDGWLRTGDVARWTPGGHLRIVGRVKSVINVGGSKCFPEEIEAVLEQDEAVLEARVTAHPHEMWGALPVAEIVARDPGIPPDTAALLRRCRSQLAPHKVPVRIRLVARVARTSSGKIIRRTEDGAAR